MSRYFIAGLEVEGFRGINNEGNPLKLRFKVDAVNSVFGPNGFGKSSLYEALCFAMRGTVPKLDRLQAADQPQQFYCNRFHSGRRASIKLTLTPDDGGADIDILVERDAAGTRRVSSPSDHADPEGLLQLLREDSVLLDYMTFQRFIADSALERGRTFTALLGLSSLSEHRQALQMLASTQGLNNDLALATLEQQKRAVAAAIDAATRRIAAGCQKLLGGEWPLPEPFDVNAIVTAVTKALQGVPLLRPTFENVDLLTVDFEEVKRRIREEEGGARRDRLAALLRMLAELEAMAPSASEDVELSQLERLVAERDAALATTRGPLFKEMFEAVDRVMRSGDWEDPAQCPACDSRPTTPAAEHVAAQLTHFDAVRGAQVRIAAMASAGWIARLKMLEEAPVMGVEPAQRLHTALTRDCTAGVVEKAAVVAVRAAIAELERRRLAEIATLTIERRTLEAELPPSLVILTEQVEAAQRIRLALEERALHANTAEEVGKKLSKRLSWKAFITDACQAFSDAEAELSLTRTKDLEASYKGMFKTIMSGDEVMPDLRKPPGAEDLHLRLERFHGLGDVPATPLLSESYRNALAISLFLSAALRSSAPPRFIVLDDITSSFDAGHQWFLMEMLRTQVAVPCNPDGLQVIVLSHDGLLEKYFDSLSGTSGWHHQRLQGRPPKGAVVTLSQENERLRADAERFLRAGQVKQAEPLIRQYLEYKLLQVISKVRISVPLDFAIKDHLHMVQNCLRVITEAVDLHKAAGRLALDPAKEADLGTIHVPALAGNWVAHYETGTSASLSPTVLLGVLDTVDAFADCFKYDCRCQGAAPRRRYLKSLDAKYCRC